MSEDFPTTSEHFQSCLKSRGNGQNIFGQQLPAFLGAAASVSNGFLYALKAYLVNLELP